MLLKKDRLDVPLEASNIESLICIKNEKPYQVRIIKHTKIDYTKHVQMTSCEIKKNFTLQGSQFVKNYAPEIFGVRIKD